MQTVGIRQEGPLMYISEQQLGTLKLNGPEKSIRYSQILLQVVLAGQVTG
jgi:hypothetical protein